MMGGSTEGTIREFKLGCEGWKEETEVVGGACFTILFYTDKIAQIGWLRFMEEIVTVFCIEPCQILLTVCSQYLM